jgi:hypothetical protein
MNPLSFVITNMTNMQQNMNPPHFYIPKNIKYEKNAEYSILLPGLGAAPRPGVRYKKYAKYAEYAKYTKYDILLMYGFYGFLRVELTALPLLLCAGLCNSDAVDMFGLLTAYRVVLFSSGNALHAVPLSALLRLCWS